MMMTDKRRLLLRLLRGSLRRRPSERGAQTEEECLKSSVRRIDAVAISFTSGLFRRTHCRDAVVCADTVRGSNRISGNV